MRSTFVLFSIVSFLISAGAQLLPPVDVEYDNDNVVRPPVAPVVIEEEETISCSLQQPIVPDESVYFGVTEDCFLYFVRAPSLIRNISFEVENLILTKNSSRSKEDVLWNGRCRRERTWVGMLMRDGVIAPYLVIQEPELRRPAKTRILMAKRFVESFKDNACHPKTIKVDLPLIVCDFAATETFEMQIRFDRLNETLHDVVGYGGHLHITTFLLVANSYYHYVYKLYDGEILRKQVFPIKKSHENDESIVLDLESRNLVKKQRNNVNGSTITVVPNSHLAKYGSQYHIFFNGTLESQPTFNLNGPELAPDSVLNDFMILTSQSGKWNGLKFIYRVGSNEDAECIGNLSGRMYMLTKTQLQYFKRFYNPQIEYVPFKAFFEHHEKETIHRIAELQQVKPKETVIDCPSFYPKYLFYTVFGNTVIIFLVSLTFIAKSFQLLCYRRSSKGDQFSLGPDENTYFLIPANVDRFEKNAWNINVSGSGMQIRHISSEDLMHLMTSVKAIFLSNSMELGSKTRKFGDEEFRKAVMKRIVRVTDGGSENQPEDAMGNFLIETALIFSSRKSNRVFVPAAIALALIRAAVKALKEDPQKTTFCRKVAKTTEYAIFPPLDGDLYRILLFLNTHSWPFAASHQSPVVFLGDYVGDGLYMLPSLLLVCGMIANGFNAIFLKGRMEYDILRNEAAKNRFQHAIQKALEMKWVRHDKKVCLNADAESHAKLLVEACCELFELMPCGAELPLGEKEKMFVTYASLPDENLMSYSRLMKTPLPISRFWKRRRTTLAQVEKSMFESNPQVNVKFLSNAMDAPLLNYQAFCEWKYVLANGYKDKEMSFKEKFNAEEKGSEMQSEVDDRPKTIKAKHLVSNSEAKKKETCMVRFLRFWKIPHLKYVLRKYEPPLGFMSATYVGAYLKKHKLKRLIVGGLPFSQMVSTNCSRTIHIGRNSFISVSGISQEGQDCSMTFHQFTELRSYLADLKKKKAPDMTFDEKHVDSEEEDRVTPESSQPLSSDAAKYESSAKENDQRHNDTAFAKSNEPEEKKISSDNLGKLLFPEI